MKGLLLLPKMKGPMGKMHGPEDDEDEDDGGAFDEKDFSDLFDAFADSLGVAPENAAKAAKRLKALISMVCSSYM